MARRGVAPLQASTEQHDTASVTERERFTKTHAGDVADARRCA